MTEGDPFEDSTPPHLTILKCTSHRAISPSTPRFGRNLTADGLPRHRNIDPGTFFQKNDRTKIKFGLFHPSTILFSPTGQINFNQTTI